MTVLVSVMLIRRCNLYLVLLFFFFQAEDGIRDHCVTGVQTCALPICRGIAEVGDGDVEQVPLVIHHVGLEVVRGFPDRTRCEPRPAAEGAGVIVGHAEQGDAGGVVLRDGVREVGRGHPEAATAWAYLRTRPLNSSSAGGGRACPCT